MQMLQLYLFCGLLIVIFWGGLGTIFLVLNHNYRKTHYFYVTHQPFLKVIRSKGFWGEYQTYKLLRNIKGNVRFLFNLYLPKENDETTEVDVLMIHESGIYVFESKNYSGWIFGTESQRTWTQSLPAGRRSTKNHFLNPIMQNQLHIKYLQQCLSDYPDIIYHSFILFSDRCELKKITIDKGTAEVMNRRWVPTRIKKSINQTGKILSKEEIQAIYHKLFPYSQTDEGSKKIHIENIRSKYPVKKMKYNALNTVTSELAQHSTAMNGKNQEYNQIIIEDIGKGDKKQRNHGEVKEAHTKKVCPRCGKPMIFREAKRGNHVGEKFWGCSGFPKCRYIEKEDG